MVKLITLTITFEWSQINEFLPCCKKIYTYTHFHTCALSVKARVILNVAVKITLLSVQRLHQSHRLNNAVPFGFIVIESKLIRN